MQRKSNHKKKRTHLNLNTYIVAFIHFPCFYVVKCSPLLSPIFDLSTPFFMCMTEVTTSMEALTLLQLLLHSFAFTKPNLSLIIFCSFTVLHKYYIHMCMGVCVFSCFVIFFLSSVTNKQTLVRIFYYFSHAFTHFCYCLECFFFQCCCQISLFARFTLPIISGHVVLALRYICFIDFSYVPICFSYFVLISFVCLRDI